LRKLVEQLEQTKADKTIVDNELDKVKHSEGNIEWFRFKKFDFVVLES